VIDADRMITASRGGVSDGGRSLGT
jgi:hypothetical protein